MLITENVLRKIIAEEYQKLVEESGGVDVEESDGVNIKALLDALKGAKGDAIAIGKELDKYKFNPNDAYDIIEKVAGQNLISFPAATDTVRVIQNYFRTKGIKPEAKPAYDPSGPYDPNAPVYNTRWAKY